MLARTVCFALQGVDGCPVWVETDISSSLQPASRGLVISIISMMNSR